MLSTLLVALALHRVEADTTGGGQDLLLVGIVLRDGDKSFAIIEDRQTKKSAFYTSGAVVDGVRVVKILRDRVTLTLGDAGLELRLAAGGANEAQPVGSIETSRPRLDASDSPDRPNQEGNGGSAPGRAGEARSLATPSGDVNKDPKIDEVAGGGSSAPPASPTGDTEAQNAASAAGAQLKFVGLLNDSSRVEAGQFPIGSVRDLLIDVSYPDLSGSFVQRIDIFAPDGSLYQQLSGGITLTSGGASETGLPVGGTWITQHSLSGAWRVAVYLGGATTPIASGSFALTR